MDIAALLGDDASLLLDHHATAFPKDWLTLPGPNFIQDIFTQSDRTPTVLRNLGTLYNHGRLGGTGYVSILPVDQGIEHSAAANFSPNPEYFDPARLCDLAIAADCNAIATTLGTLGIVSRRYVHRIPFIVKINHNDLFRYPNTYDQRMFASVQQASDLGAVGVGATIYFGSEGSIRQIEEISAAFAEAHRLGLFTVLWCYTRNDAFKTAEADYHVAADLTGQANHLGVTIEADIIKQKQPENNGGFNALKFSKTNPKVYSELTSDNPIDLTRWQVVNCYAGRVGLINSGGEAKGNNDLAGAVRTAVINKRAGGQGLIMGRKAFQRPIDEGAALVHAVQDVYLDASITVA
ncbi:MAG: class I fructose-bisphosphate aldolase [Acidobacteriota bacterium]|nr:class I fructose-bisphosphate aldolase [Acidobacteriota bacterium]MDE3094249.1 class I fructose-bisphosphate aldolase [Acidobacteriota bacterium]MDE3139426.1 class I fructose-bisphosphate aldolase [Acidobacteriota bacterium]MDE3147082.1 class I fructose-bisphosphate aldolase [Acidobacteriota bacterium]